MTGTGNIEALCLSRKKGERKTPVALATFVENYGIEGDAHAGDWHRQVSLLAAEDIDTMREKGLPALMAGDFAENIVVSGIDLAGLGLGSRLKIGSDVEMVVTQIGKVCHTRCAIYDQTGDCIMPRRGIFARVLKGGTVHTQDEVTVSQTVSRDLFQCVILTVSDRCSRGETVDTAGPAVSALICRKLPARLYQTEIIPDEQDLIVQRLRHYCDGHSIDLVVTVGGTGFAPRDVTPEAVTEVAQRLAPGLGEAMRAASSVKTPHAMLSRSVCGIRNSTLIVSLPGSKRGATENMEVILPALEHGLAKLRGEMSDCGREPSRP